MDKRLIFDFLRRHWMIFTGIFACVGTGDYNMTVKERNW